MQEAQLKLFDHLCPNCGSAANQSFHDHRRGDAKVGEASVCRNCGAINEYDAHMKLKRASSETTRLWESKCPALWAAVEKTSNDVCEKKLTRRST